MKEININNAKLLLVEDNPRSMEIIKRFLVTRFGYQYVTEASSAAKAIEILDKEHFDVIIADMRMETEDSGFGVIEEVRKKNISSVVIIFTANESWIDCRKAFRQLVCWDYISKNIEGVNPYVELNSSIKEAIAYFNRWGNRNDESWIFENHTYLLEKYCGNYIAVINHTVIEQAITEEELRLKINERKLPQFIPVIKKIENMLLHLKPVQCLIETGENNVLEFKSTLCYDVNTGKQNDNLSKLSLKTIASFLNTEGGTLVIGINDNKEVIGLDQDYAILGYRRDNRDLFENKMRNMISDQISKVYASSEYITVRYEQVTEKDVCIVDVKKGHEPAFYSPNKEFYIRTGNSSRALNSEEFFIHIKTKRQAWSII